MNKVMIVGEVMYPPRYNDNQWGGVLSMMIKTTNRYKDNNGVIQERHQSVRTSLWGKLAELNRGVQQGDIVSLDGRLQNKKVQKKDGSEEWVTEVVANAFETIVGGGNAPAGDQFGEPAAPPAADEFGDDDIPF